MYENITPFSRGKIHHATDQEVLDEAAELVHTKDDPEAVVQDEAHTID